MQETRGQAVGAFQMDDTGAPDGATGVAEEGPSQAAQPYALRIFSGRDKSEQRRWGAVLQQVQDWLQVEAPTVLDVKAHVTANGKAVVCVVFDSTTGVTTGRPDAGVYMLHTCPYVCPYAAHMSICMPIHMCVSADQAINM